MLSEIVNHLWQSTLFAVSIAALALLLRNNGAHARYWLWWAASVKFLVPFALLAMLGNALLGGAGPLYVFSDWSAAIETLAEPMPASSEWSALALLLLALWACGFAAVLARWLARAAQVRAVLRAAAPWPNSPLAGARAPAVRCTDSLVEPGIVGLFRPVLLLPRGITAQLTAEQLQAVLAHELCHWRRRDNLTAAVHMLAEAVFWFHPLVWWIGARLIDEREQACDESVVRAGHDRETYAEGILNVCELYVASPLPCAAGVSGADLKQRIVRIAKSLPAAELSIAKKLVLGTAALGALAVPIALGIGSAAFAQGNDDVIPLVRIAPDYPPDALAMGLEGTVTLEFTVTENGTTTDIVAVDSTSPLFEAPAIEALRRWRYAPRTADGLPIERRGVRTIIRFQLAPD